jgi:sec-independent protein translocase protein TatC
MIPMDNPLEQPSSNLPQFFESSGIDPGTGISSSLPEPPPGDGFDHESTAMPMVAHIAELRNRILLCAALLAVGIGLGFTFSLQLIQVFQSMAPPSVVFVQRAPGEVLMASVNLSFYFGVALALPVILYNMLRFILPGLLPRERGMVTWAVLGGTVLFMAGIVFAYFFVAPSALLFLVDYGQSVARPELSIRDYISFCSSLLFVTGGMFELPMILFLLSFAGLITSQKLIREWRWATVLIFITAAIVTPTQDPFSMAIVGIAMVALYGLSIIPIRLCGR